MQLRKSGVINGRASVFVIPVEMPVAMDALSVTVEERVSGWGAVAADMAADINAVREQVAMPASVSAEEPASVSETYDMSSDGAVANRALDGRDNPFAWADKDVYWQRGVSL